MKLSYAMIATALFVSNIALGDGNENEPEAALRLLQAENRLLRATIEARDKTIKELQGQIQSMQTEMDRLRRVESTPPAPTSEPAVASEDSDAPALGVRVMSIDGRIKKALKEDGILPVPVSGGVMVTGLSLNGPAHVADIHELDVISAINGTRVLGVDSFFSAIRSLQVGKTALLTIYRMSDRKVAGKRLWSQKTVRVVPTERQTMLQEAKGCPLVLVSAKLDYNSIGSPTVSLVVKNIGPQDVVAYSVEIHCWDRFDAPVKNSMLRDDNVFGGISQRTVRPGETEGRDTYWTLHMYDNTAKVKIVLTRVRLDDGSEWTPDGEEVSIETESSR